MRKADIFETVTTRGALLPASFLMKLSGKTNEVTKTKPEDYNHSGQKLNEVISRAWNTLLLQWAHFRSIQEPTTAQTRERWLIPLFRELDYGNLKRAEKQQIDGKDYPISHLRDSVPIHLLGTQTDLDHRTPGTTKQIPHSMFQEYLNKPDSPQWGLLSNGIKLRILRENASMTRQSYIEFDLEKMMEGQTYSDFVLLYLICHESRFTESQIIETWHQEAKKDGIRALDSLRTGVKEAIEALGKGFFNNPAIREKLRVEGYKQDYYRQLLRVAYRMIFMLTAESRDLLLNPETNQEVKDRYYSYYSITRIRNLAEKKRGTRHKDLWKALNITIEKLCGTEPTPELGISPMGSFLWSKDATRDLNEADIENKYLLEAVRAITLIRKENITTRVDYRNLGAEELGSIYESLLEMKPQINADAKQFNLLITAGNERKTTGSYYTPTELINELLNSALDPVIKTKKTEEEILNTKVCDPACGSGHFLIAAAHRMARHLAAIRTQEEEPDPKTYRTALRDIISHCIYGVDINPMSVELCKISLWLEAIEPGKPLSFLDHHIKCGNSLIGTSPKLMIDTETNLTAIPDEAFSPITGDDKKTASALKKTNKQQRITGQRDLFMGHTNEEATIKQIALRVAELDQKDQSTINQLKQKEVEYKQVTTSNQFNTEKTKANIWCAAFVQNKTESSETPITTETLRAYEENSKTLTQETASEVTKLAEHYQFFHWYIEFPEVFQRGTKELNGFDVVLGNPPWEHTELKEKEFFAARDEKIANAPGSRRKKLISQLEQTDPALYQSFVNTKREHDAQSHFIRNSSKYPLCGLGRINTYAIFAELNKNLMNSAGRVGCILQSGIATDDTTKFYFQELIEKKMLVSLFDFENRKNIFEAVDSRMKFCLLTLSGIPVKEAEFVFFAHQVEDLKSEEKRFTLSKEDIELLNPNTKTCPIFRTKRDAEITKSIYRRVPVLINENDPENGNPWGITFKQGLFNMTSDSGLFKTKEQLENQGWDLNKNIFEKGESKYLPLYEAKMIHHYNHRFGDYRDLPKGSKSTQLPRVPLERLQDPNYEPLPRYWVPEEEVEERLAKVGWKHKWLLGWRDITNVTNERTMIASFLPYCGVGHTIPLFLSDGDPKRLLFLYAQMASFAFDWVCRQKMGGTHLTYHYLKQLSVLSAQVLNQDFTCMSDLMTSPRKVSLSDWIVELVLELVYTSVILREFAESCGYFGAPYKWNEERHFRIRCELDAIFFHLYGIKRDDLEFIMNTFPIVKQKDENGYGSYRTSERILKNFDEMSF